MKHRWLYAALAVMVLIPNLGASAKIAQTLKTVLPADAREITFPADMAAWGWMDVTRNGTAIHTGQTPDPGCPDAVPNKSDSASVTQTTQAIQCRLNYIGYVSPSPVMNVGSLYFPAGTYYINQTLSMTSGYWVPGAANQPPVYKPFGHGRSLIHISGEDPRTTKIVWAGSCNPAANVSVAGITKYNDIFYINGLHSFTLERLALDGAKEADGKTNCAGSAVDLVSKPSNISGISLNELIIQNFKEAGIVGDRPSMTADELTVGVEQKGAPFSEKDTTGMVSEVTITNSQFTDIDFAAIMPNAYNAVDWWIRDSSFHNCNIGIAANSGGVGWAAPGMPHTPPLPWGPNGIGGFQVANSFFENSRTVDIASGQMTSVRNNYSIATKAPFLESAGGVIVQGNTVIASPGVIPILSWGGSAGLGVDQLLLFQNQFVTQSNAPAVIVWTGTWGLNYPLNFLQKANPTVGNLWNETYSNVASIGNKFTSTAPFANVTGAQMNAMGSAQVPGWTPPIANGLECGPMGAVSAMIDERTVCSLANADMKPVYNLLTLNDTLGARLKPVPPAMPPIRPIVQRNSIVLPNNHLPNAFQKSSQNCLAQMSEENTEIAARANSCAIQSALNTLAAQQSHCSPDDYYCKNRWNILFIPSGNFPIAATIDVPAKVQLQIIGTGASTLYWFWSSEGTAGPAGAIFKFHSPAHIAMRDLSLLGEPNPNNNDPVGAGLIAEVTDLTTSRVYADTVRGTGPITVEGIGNVAFQMKSFSNGENATIPNKIIGNNAKNAGYFAYFMGNPTNLFVGGGANLMIQDAWYEGPDSSFVSCMPGDSSHITVMSSNLSMAGWHANQSTVTPYTTFNLNGCATKTAVIGSFVTREVCFAAGSISKAPKPLFPSIDGCIAPPQDLILANASDAKTQVMFLGVNTANSSYPGPYGDTTTGVVPMGPDALPASLDQAALIVEKDSQAQYVNLLGTFMQKAQFMKPGPKSAPDPVPTIAAFQLAAKNTGKLDSAFIQSMLGQAFDPRLMAPPRLVSPITDTHSTDIRLERMWIRGSVHDMQFILPDKE